MIPQFKKVNFYTFFILFSDLETTAAEMVKLYCESIPLSNALDPQENMHGEGLLPLACNIHVMVSIYSCKG